MTPVIEKGGLKFLYSNAVQQLARHSAGCIIESTLPMGEVADILKAVHQIFDAPPGALVTLVSRII
jgi:hypothetical protein